MPNWVLATEEFPRDMIGYVFSDESIWFLNNGYYSPSYDGYSISTDNQSQSISKINTNYITDKNGTYYGDGSKIYSHVATTPLYNDNGHITFDIYELIDGYKLLKGCIPDEYGSPWCTIDVGYNTQNIDTDYEKISFDFKWSGIINDEVLNELIRQNEEKEAERISYNSDMKSYDIYFGYECGHSYTKDDILEYTSGTNFTSEFLENTIEYENKDGTENIFIMIKYYSWIFTIDSNTACYSMFFYNRHENKWYYYILWDDKNGNTYYYDATDCYKNKTWLHVEYSQYKSDATLKLGERTFTFPVNNETVKLKLFSRLMPIFRDNRYDDNFEYSYYIYGYTQIANIKSYVVPLDEDLGFDAPYVYVKNSNYRDHFFLSAEVDNYDPAGYEILWDNGERTKSIACEFGEYHEVTVTNRAGSTTDWNIAGFGEVHEYNYHADIGIVSIPLTETGTIINAANYYNITNNTQYSENCSIQYYANVNSIIANDLGTVYINKKSDAVSALHENGHYTLSVSRYDDYSEYATGIGFTVSWKMKLLNNIDYWLADAQSNVNYDVECFGYLLCFDGYGQSGIHLYLTSVDNTLCIAAKSAKDTSKKSILPSEFINGEWVECMLCKCDDNKYFFNVNGYTLFDFEDDSLSDTVYLFNTVLLGANRVDLKNTKTPYVILKDIKRSMQLRKVK